MARTPQKPTRIRKQQKTSFRKHYLAEWLDVRDMEPMDLVRLLNEPEEAQPIDKSQVYKWIKGQLPQGPNAIRLAAALELLNVETGEPDPELLLSHPAQDWIARRVKGLAKKDTDDVQQLLDMWLARRTG